MFGRSKRKQFEKLFLPQLDEAYNLARYLCGNDYDAEDNVQESYMRAYRAFGQFTDDNSRAWILTITRNTCYSWIRRHNRRTTRPYVDDSGMAGMEASLTEPACHRSAEQIAESDCNRQRVRRAIGMLPQEFREVTVLRELEGLSYREIGTVLEIPVGTVMSRLSRARSRLRELLVEMNGN